MKFREPEVGAICDSVRSTVATLCIVRLICWLHTLIVQINFGKLVDKNWAHLEEDAAKLRFQPGKL